MNTSAVQYTAEQPWSRRGSVESILSIQGKETDIVCDTTDTEPYSDDEEYEPVTDVEDEDQPPVSEDSSGESDNDIISTKVVEVSVGDDGDLQFADSEQTDTDEVDSEVDMRDYWKCAQCNAKNNDPLYRYCEKCFKVRKNFFPPRPKRKHKPTPTLDLGAKMPRILSQDSGVESQEISQNPTLGFETKFPSTLSQDSGVESLSQNDQPGTSSQHFETTHSENRLLNSLLIRPGGGIKRRCESVDRNNKRSKRDYSDSGSETSDSENNGNPVTPLVKTISDPSVTVEATLPRKGLTKKVISYGLKQKIDREKEKVQEVVEVDDKSDKDDNMCIVCVSEPKSGVFVHGRIAHICCCYKCAVKVWCKAKRCPVCNCRVSNVLRAVVM